MNITRIQKSGFCCELRFISNRVFVSYFLCLYSKMLFPPSASHPDGPQTTDRRYGPISVPGFLVSWREVPCLKLSALLTCMLGLSSELLTLLALHCCESIIPTSKLSVVLTCILFMFLDRLSVSVFFHHVSICCPINFLSARFFLSCKC